MNFEIIKISWVLAAIICTILVFFYFTPVSKYQKVYRDYIFSVASVPQKRVNKTIRFVEQYQNGEIPIEYIYLMDTHPKSRIVHQNTNVIPEKSKTIRKPLYIRDKNNPNILYKYKE